MQPHTPVGGLIKGGDPGECQRQPVRLCVVRPRARMLFSL